MIYVILVILSPESPELSPEIVQGGRTIWEFGISRRRIGDRIIGIITIITTFGCKIVQSLTILVIILDFGDFVIITTFEARRSFAAIRWDPP